MNNPSELLSILKEEVDLKNYWKKLWEFLQESPDQPEMLNLIEETYQKRRDYYISQEFTAARYEPEHPLWNYCNTYYGTLPEDWEADKIGHFVKLYLSGPGVQKPEDMEAIATLDGLKQLNITSSKVEDFSALNLLTQLEKLSISLSYNVKRFTGLHRLQHLVELQISSAEGFKFDGLAQMGKLTSLSVEGGQLSIMPEFPSQLKTLDLSWTPVKSLEGVEKAAKLERLLCFNCRQLEDIEALQYCPRVRYLNLFGCQQLKNVAALQPLKKLDYLQLEGSKQLDVLPNRPTLNSTQSISAFRRRIKKHYQEKTTAAEPVLSPLDQQLLKLVIRESQSTCSELERAMEAGGIDWKGQESWHFENYPQVLLWEGWSKPVITSLQRLLQAKLIEVRKLNDNFDGALYLDRTEREHRLRGIPLARQKRKYKDERWMPHWICDPESSTEGGLSW